MLHNLRVAGLLGINTSVEGYKPCGFARLSVEKSAICVTTPKETVRLPREQIREIREIERPSPYIMICAGPNCAIEWVFFRTSNHQSLREELQKWRYETSKSAWSVFPSENEALARVG